MEYRIDPKGIEEESMAIIEGLVPTLPQDPLARAVVKRVIHTTGDPDYVKLVSYSPGALEAGQKALAGGAKIITDVNLVKAGVTSVYQKKYGGQVYCFLNDPQVVERALACGQTRAMTAMELALEQLEGGIVAIGNAPTALFKLLELLAENPLKRPALIIGTPVGRSEERRVGERVYI